ncbi:hypothetical protein JXA59_02295 [Patescibacteria group bacterium]|nr:hypothetical protein [Patescibacteria group bacterium]
MTILAALDLALKLIGAFIAVGLDSEGGLARVNELLTQLKSLGEEALSRLFQRVHIVREVLTRVSIPTLGEFQEFMDTKVLLWLPKPSRSPKLPKGNWQAERLKIQQKAWVKVGIDLPQALCDKFVDILNQCGAELVAQLEAYGFMFVITADVTWTASTWPTGWVKPNDWYWQVLNGGRVIGSDDKPIEACRLLGHILLIDTRQKPRYAGGHQRWKDDVFMEALIGYLQDRKLLLVNDNAGRGSRFYLSRNDYTNVVAPAFVEALQQLGVPVQTARLEYCPEHSALCQLFNSPRKDNGKTNTWLWFQEYLDSSEGSLGGGDSDDGGLADVGYDDSGGRWDYASGSLVAVLA